MKIEYIEIKKLPLIIIDDFFNDDESKEILNEFKELDKHLSEDPIVNGSAWKENENNEKVYLKKARGAFVDQIFNGNRNSSKILTLNRKLFNIDFMNTLVDLHFFFDYLKNSSADTTMVHYYENSDMYDFHSDAAVITALSWHYREPKRFSGGELIIDAGQKISIEPLNKRILIFPSIVRHSVEKISMSDEYKNQNLGRYSMAQFVFVSR